MKPAGKPWSSTLVDLASTNFSTFLLQPIDQARSRRVHRRQRLCAAQQSRQVAAAGNLSLTYICHNDGVSMTLGATRAAQSPAPIEHW
jgi:hypothetical protein